MSHRVPVPDAAPLGAFLSLALVLGLLASIPSAAAEQHTGFGVTLGIEAPDVAVAVRAVGGSAICYIDAGGDDSYRAGEPVILRMSGGCSGLSSGRDIRLADWEGLPAGARLGASADSNKPLSQPASSASIWYFDANGNNRMDHGDTVYANIVNGQLGFVDNGDVRMSPFGDHPAGSVVGSGDDDLSFGLRLLGAPSEAVAMVDTNGNGFFDSGESLYLNADLGGTELVEFGDLRITPIDEDRPYGSFVQFGDSDGSAFYTMVDRSPCVTDADGSGGYTPGEGLYLDLDADCLGSVAQGDVRLVSVGDGAAGSRVATGDADTGTAYRAVENTRIAYLDQDGDSRYGPADLMFIDLVDPAANRLDQGDVRLTPRGSEPGGHVLETGDAELGRSVTNLGLFSASVGFLSISGGTSPSPDEPLYLNAEPRSGEGIVPGDVRLVPIRDLSYGGAATLATQEVLPRFVSGGGSFCVSSSDQSDYKVGDAVYLSFEGCPSQLRAGAIRLVPVGSFEPGSVVGAADADIGSALTSPVGQHWWFFDSDGDNEWSPGDHLYADLVNPAQTRVDVGDVRITQVGVLAAGRAVHAQDSDVNLPLRSLGSVGSHTVFVDSNGDNRFAGGDLPYVNADGGGTYVTLHDVRLAPLPERHEPATESPSPEPEPSPDPTEDATTSPSPSPSPTPPDQSLTDSPPPTEGDNGDSPRTPGPGIAFVLAAFAFVAWVGRRRL